MWNNSGLEVFLYFCVGWCVLRGDAYSAEILFFHIQRWDHSRNIERQLKLATWNSMGSLGSKINKHVNQENQPLPQLEILKNRLRV